MINKFKFIGSNLIDIFSKFNSQVKKEKQDLIEIANFFNDMTSIETRLQIVHFLFAVSNADGHVSKQEVNKILEISRFFSINIKDFESIKAMFIKKLLGGKQNGTFGDIKNQVDLSMHTKDN